MHPNGAGPDVNKDTGWLKRAVCAPSRGKASGVDAMGDSASGAWRWQRVGRKG